MLKTETDHLSIGLYIMVVVDVLQTRMSTHARKEQKSHNYLNRDSCWQNENDIPIKDDAVAKNWAKNYMGK